MYGLNEAHNMDANEPCGTVFTPIKFFLAPPPLQCYKSNCWNNVELIFAHLLITFFLL